MVGTSATKPFPLPVFWGRRVAKHPKGFLKSPLKMITLLGTLGSIFIYAVNAEMTLHRRAEGFLH